MAGAPQGNKNAAKGRKWQKAIERALARAANSTVSAGLDEAANLFVKAVRSGDQWALKELGDRIDGRPAQALTVGGDEDNPLFPAIIEVNVIRPKKRTDPTEDRT